MKKISFLLLVAAFFAGCGVTDVEPMYLDVDGTEYDLEVGYIFDWGTNNDITYRQYEMTFADLSDDPSVYITFDVFSTSTLRLEEGTYYYDSGYEVGKFTNVEIGTDMEYDSSGEAVAGTRMSDWTWDYSGTIVVSMESDIYKFEFDLVAEKDGVSHTIQGQFSELLEEGWISTKKK